MRPKMYLCLKLVRNRKPIQRIKFCCEGNLPDDVYFWRAETLLKCPAYVNWPHIRYDAFWIDRNPLQGGCFVAKNRLCLSCIYPLWKVGGEATAPGAANDSSTDHLMRLFLAIKGNINS